MRADDNVGTELQPLRTATLACRTFVNGVGVLDDGIGLPLERAAGVDHQLDVHRLQDASEPGCHGIAAPAFALAAGGCFQPVDFAPQLVWVAARDHQFNARRARQVPANDAAEVAVAADHHHPECHCLLP